MEGRKRRRKSECVIGLLQQKSQKQKLNFRVSKNSELLTSDLLIRISEWTGLRTWAYLSLVRRDWHAVIQEQWLRRKNTFLSEECEREVRATLLFIKNETTFPLEWPLLLISSSLKEPPAEGSYRCADCFTSLPVKEPACPRERFVFLPKCSINWLACYDCQNNVDSWLHLIPTSEVKSKYRLSETRLEELRHQEEEEKETSDLIPLKKTNPHRPSGALMRLWWKAAIKRRLYHVFHPSRQAWRDYRDLLNSRKEKMKEKREQSVNDRRTQLCSALEVHGLTLRSDSMLCQAFIAGSREARSLEQVVQEMRRMAVIHQRLNFASLKIRGPRWQHHDSIWSQWTKHCSSSQPPLDPWSVSGNVAGFRYYFSNNKEWD